jgi:transposase-like protein
VATSPPSDLPDFEVCEEFLKKYRFGCTLSCIYCDNTDPQVIKKGRTQKGIQQYHCRDCDRYFNLLTNTIFADHRLGLEEMFYIIDQMDEHPISAIAEELDRTYKTVLNFAHEVEGATEPEAKWISVVKDWRAETSYTGRVPAAGPGSVYIEEPE